MGIDSQLEAYIYDEILKYRRTPKDLFSGSAQYIEPLLSMLSRNQTLSNEAADDSSLDQ